MRLAAKTFILFAVIKQVIGVPPELAAYYAQHQPEIDALSATVLSEARSVEQREEAFLVLQSKYPDAAFAAAAQLATSNIPVLAVTSVNVLASRAVMSDHGRVFRSGHTMTAGQHHLMEHHEAALEPLRRVAALGSEPLREKAAEVLASLSDREGLRLVNEGVKSGRFTPEQAVSYIALAAPEVSRAYLPPYLDSESPRVKALAVAAAARVPEYKDLVAKIAGDPQAHPEVRKMAINGLSGDPKAAGSLLAIALNPSSEDHVAATAAQAYAKTATITKPKRLELDQALSAFKSSERSELFKPAIRAIEIERAKGI